MAYNFDYGEQHITCILNVLESKSDLFDIEYIRTCQYQEEMMVVNQLVIDERLLIYSFNDNVCENKDQFIHLYAGSMTFFLSRTDQKNTKTNRRKIHTGSLLIL